MAGAGARMLLVVMGVSGSGKTSVGARVALRLGWPFMEGDELHSPADVAQMHAGHPLEDADRWPWLARIGAWLDQQQARGEPGVVACSALKRSYRDFLRRDRANVCFIHLRVSRDELALRLRQRVGHYMPPLLLDSQLATLEELQADEPAIVIGADADLETVVEAVLAAIEAALAANPRP